jgi:hypothetical protein
MGVLCSPLLSIGRVDFLYHVCINKYDIAQRAKTLEPRCHEISICVIGGEERLLVVPGRTNNAASGAVESLA